MAQITDFASLTARIKTWCARSDTTFSNEIETFIALAEMRMQNGQGSQGDPLYCESLAVAEKEVKVTLNVVAGFVSYPLDGSSTRTLRRPGDMLGLEYMTPRQFALMDNEITSGLPTNYTVEGNQIRITPAYTGTMELIYWKNFPAINSSNTTNTILTLYPLLYLTGCLFEAFSWTQDIDLAAGHFARYKAIVDGINASEFATRYGGGPLRVRTRQAIP